MHTTKEWWNFSSTGPLRSLEPGFENPSPYKDSDHLPLFELPGGSLPDRLRTDPTHTYAIGYGKDETASILLMLVNCGHFGHRGNIQVKFDRAFERFAIWCKAQKKHTSITSFSNKEFKISGFLGGT